MQGTAGSSLECGGSRCRKLQGARHHAAVDHTTELLARCVGQPMGHAAQETGLGGGSPTSTGPGVPTCVQRSREADRSLQHAHHCAAVVGEVTHVGCQPDCRHGSTPHSRAACTCFVHVQARTPHARGHTYVEEGAPAACHRSEKHDMPERRVDPASQCRPQPQVAHRVGQDAKQQRQAGPHPVMPLHAVIEYPSASQRTHTHVRHSCGPHEQRRPAHRGGRGSDGGGTAACKPAASQDARLTR